MSLQSKGKSGRREKKDSPDSVTDIRIRCMLQGAWFNSCTVIVRGIISSQKANSAKPLRFVRLVSHNEHICRHSSCQSPNKRTLAWGDFSHRPSPPPSYESLRERGELSHTSSAAKFTSSRSVQYDEYPPANRMSRQHTLTQSRLKAVFLTHVWNRALLVRSRCGSRGTIGRMDRWDTGAGRTRRDGDERNDELCSCE